MNSLEILGHLDGGQMQRDLDTALLDAVRECRDLSGTAKITVQLTVAPRGVKQVEITAKIDTKLPQRERDTAFFFVDPNGALTRKDPDQHEFDLQEQRVVQMTPAVAVGQ